MALLGIKDQAIFSLLEEEAIKKYPSAPIPKVSQPEVELAINRFPVVVAADAMLWMAVPEAMVVGKLEYVNNVEEDAMLMGRLE